MVATDKTNDVETHACTNTVALISLNIIVSSQQGNTKPLGHVWF
jgi:hypothetical protein